jgi:hypothetical protein
MVTFVMRVTLSVATEGDASGKEGTPPVDREGGDTPMGAVLLVLLLALVLGGLGFAVHVLWWIALVVLVIWLIGFAARSGGSARWYRW